MREHRITQPALSPPPANIRTRLRELMYVTCAVGAKRGIHATLHPTKAQNCTDSLNLAPFFLLVPVRTSSRAHYVPSSRWPPPSCSLAEARRCCRRRRRGRRYVWLFRAPYLWKRSRITFVVPHVREPLWDFYLTLYLWTLCTARSRCEGGTGGNLSSLME